MAQSPQPADSTDRVQPRDPAQADRAASYATMRRIALVSGVVAVLVAGLLLYDYSLRRGRDPSEVTAYQALKASLKANPGDESLTRALRRLDVQLRRDYFRHRAFTAIGAVVLLVAVSISLIAGRQAATLNRPLPRPGPHKPPQDVETRRQDAARWAVGGVALLLALVTAALALSGGPRFPVQHAAGEGAAARGGGMGRAGGSDDGAADAQPAVLAEPYPPPTLEQWNAAWPRFRGPDGSGVSPYTDVPRHWDAATGTNIRWKTPVPLPGNNSPVVWDDRVFVTGATENEAAVFAFNADSGEMLWRVDVPTTQPPEGEEITVLGETGFAAPTAVSDGQRVFAIFASGDLAAVTHDGRLAWTHSFGIPDNMYGHSSSLTMHDGLVLVQFDQGAKGDDISKMYALSAVDGSIVWQVDRSVPNSWTSPIVIRRDGKPQLITAADPWVIAYDPADGGELWRVDCLKGDCGPSPVYADGIVQIGNEYCQWSAIRVPAASGGQQPADASEPAETTSDTGDTRPEIVWTAEDGLPDTCSPLVTEEFVFLMPSTGYFTCLDAKTGEFVWEVEPEYQPEGEEESELMASFSSSPSLVDDLIYLIDKEGRSWVARPSRDGCEKVAQGNLAEECVSSPAFQPGRIYLRGKEHLFCIEEGTSPQQ